MNMACGIMPADDHSKRPVSAANRIDSTNRLPALDGLRGVAILMVFLFHYAGSIGNGPHNLFGGLISGVVGFGWTGVDLFFLLSGFLITGILYDTQNGPGYYRIFYVRRALRIFPAFYLLLAIYLGLTPFLHLHWKVGHLFFLVYLGYPAALIWPELQVISPFVMVVHFWSLCAEEQFYLAWPWMIAKARNKRAILWMCMILGICAFLLRVVIVSTHRFDPSWAYGFLPCRMDSLALGAALAVLARSPWYLRLQQWSTLAFTVAIGLTLLICIVRYSVDRYDPFIATAGYTVTAITYGALLLRCLKRGSWLNHLFSSRLLRLFGRYSYGLYLYHLSLATVLHPLKDIFIARIHSVFVGGIAYLVVAFAINLIIAGLSFHFFESPILGLKAWFQPRTDDALHAPPSPESLSAI